MLSASLDYEKGNRQKYLPYSLLSQASSPPYDQFQEAAYLRGGKHSKHQQAHLTIWVKKGLTDSKTCSTLCPKA